MTTEMMSLLLVALLIGLVMAGMRVAFAAALIGFIGLFTLFAFDKGQGIQRGFVTALQITGQIPHSKTSSHELALIPVFIFIGYLAFYAGLTRAVFEAAKRWLGWLPGGMGVATIFAAAGFAAVSGASVATAAIFSRVAIPEMLALGYSKRFAAGVVAAGGTLAALIPPSAILVVYAIIVEASVGKLLLAAFVPGLFSALSYAAIVIVQALVRKDMGPPVRGFTLRQRLESLPGILPIAAVIGIIVYCIYFGWGTPAEGGALGAFVVLLLALAKSVRPGQIWGALQESARLSVVIFSMVWGVLIFVRYLGFADLPGQFSGWVTGLDFPPMTILLILLAIYVVLGMFMDAIGMLILTLPVAFPTIIALNGGADVAIANSAFGMSGAECAIWFGIIVVKMAEICLITPPIGLNCFVVASVRDDITVSDVFRGAAPYFVADAITVACLIAFPQVVLWLPRLMGN